MRRQSLRRTIFLAILATTSLVVAIAFLVLQRQASVSTSQQAREQASTFLDRGVSIFLKWSHDFDVELSATADTADTHARWNRDITALIEQITKDYGFNQPRLRLVHAADVSGYQPMGGARSAPVGELDIDVLRRFHADPTLPAIERETDDVLRVAIPLRGAAHPACMKCHGGSDPQALMGTFHVDIPLDAYHAASTVNVATTMLLVVGLSLLTACVLWWTISRQVIRPVLTLERAVKDASKGMIAEVDLPSEVCRELQSLGDAVNWASEDQRTRQEQLEAQVFERSRLLLAAKETAEAANRTKSEFLSMMSHEVRTPLNGVLGTAQVLGESSLTYEQRQQVDLILRSGDSLLTVINDILDFSKLEVGKVTIDAVPMNIGDIVAETIQLYIPHTLEKSIQLEMVVDPEVELWRIGDPSRLRQVVSNLLSNAIKFTSVGTVRVTVKASAAEDQFLVAVEDTGIGMDEEAVASLFKPFVQADASIQRRFGGTGLGLTISSGLARLMGGTLEVRSELGVGSCFTLTVRSQPAPEHATHVPVTSVALVGFSPTMSYTTYGLLARGAHTVSMFDKLENALASNVVFEWVIVDAALLDGERAELYRRVLASRPWRMAVATSDPTDLSSLAREWPTVLAPIRPSGLQELIAGNRTSRVNDDTSVLATVERLRVLVVDDNAVNRRVASMRLEKWGHTVSIASSGEEALRILERDWAYDLVLMDVQMPGLTGVETTRRYRHIEHTTGRERLCIYAFSAGVMEEQQEVCRQADMDGFIPKPFTDADLSRVLVDEIATRRKAARQRARASA